MNIDTIGVAIGARARARRKMLDLVIPDVSRSTGLACSFISEFENGKTGISVKNLCIIADALKVSPAYFFPNEKREKIQ